MKPGKQFYLALILGFLLGNYQGYVALWEDTAREPAVIFPYRAASLPASDQAALSQGIYAQSPEDLHRLLEDLLS